MFARGSKRRRNTQLVVAGSLAGAIVLLAWWNNVLTAPRETDAKYIRLILADGGHDGLLGATAASFDDEIALIVAVQDAVLDFAPTNAGLPMSQPREPENLYKARRGLCYDRSRTIEKTLALMGFDTRHVAVYSTAKTGSALQSLLTPGIQSHAVSEVRTRRGWIVVGSNARWISLRDDGAPLSAEDLAAAAAAGATPSWSPVNQSRMNPIFARPFTYLIGLYSRHGRFYPPYTPIPDINFAEFLENFVAFDRSSI